MTAKATFHIIGYLFGLTALLPSVFDLPPAGFSEGYLTQIMLGDVLAAILALVSFIISSGGPIAAF